MRYQPAAIVGFLGFGFFVSVQFSSAQSINVDFGDDFGVPPETYNGPGLQGVWSNYNGAPTPGQLVDLEGNPIPATVQFEPFYFPPFPNKWSFGFNHAATIGGDERLYDDAIGGLADVVGQVRFVGLEPGVYDIITHAWIPQDPENVLWVWINEGLSNFQQIGGGWPGAATLGVTYARHDREEHLVGPLAVNVVRGRIFPPTDYWINGVQLIKIADLCYADCDPSTGAGVLDIFDFLCFQQGFVAGETYACDCDLSTGQGVCDVFDFLCFQNAFVSGCN